MELSKLTLGEIAVLAAGVPLVGVIIASITAFTTAAISVWNARRLAREAALRDYRRQVLGEFLKS